MRPILAAASAGIVLLSVLGCAGLIGYGTEVGRTSVTSGVPWTVTYTAAHPDPHQVWIDFDLSSEGGSYQVTGDIATGTSSWPLNFTSSGPPVSGGRMTFGTTETSFGSNQSASGSIWAVELPAVPAGTDVTVTGTWTVNDVTTVTQLDVLVTD
ncbi:MAG: hypothetical protein ACJATT_000663 [Myxococcota bacterium]|jgi:hypothetical protein